MADNQIQLAFAGGPDESTDPRHMPPGSVVTAFNQVYDADGSYSVRYGYTMLPNGPSSVFRLAVFIFELLAIDMLGGCWSYAPSDTAWVQRDTLPAVQVTHAPIFNATSSFQSWGEAVGSGYRVVGWVDSDGSAHSAIYDASTGALLSAAELTTFGCVNINVGIVAGRAIVITANTGGNIEGAYLTLATPTSAWTVVGLTTTGYISTTGVYACAFTATEVILSWEFTTSPAKLQSVSYSTTLAVTGSSNTALTGGTTGFQAMTSQATDLENLWVSIVVSFTGYSSHVLLTQSSATTLALANVQAVTVNAAIGSPTTITRMAIERVSATQCVAVFDQEQLGVSYAQFTASAQVGNSRGVFNAGIASAPVYVASASTAYMYLLMTSPTTQTGTYFAVDLLLGTTSGHVIPTIQSVLAPGIVNTAADAGAQINVPRLTLNGSAYETVLPIVRGVKGRQGLDLFTMSMQAYAKAWAGGVTLGKELYVGGSYYDGNRAVEMGFPGPAPTFSTVGTGSGATFDYIITMVRVDAQGNVEESAPSIVSSVVSNATPNVALTITPLWLTNKQRIADTVQATAGSASFVYVRVYRTQAVSSGDTTFYLVTKDPLPASLQNTQSAVSISYTDTLSDAALTDGTHPVLYTISGELPHNAPESFVASTVHMNRVWGIGADQRTIWFSQTYSDGVVPAWNDSFQVTIDDAGEPLTCLASLYDKLLVFTASKTYVIFGDGPSDAGTGATLTPPQRVPSASGCIDPRSVVNTPDGVMVQSKRGIELVGADLSTAFIGLPVSLTTATYPHCMAASLVESASCVRFAMATDEAYPADGQGAIINYDLRRKRWAVHVVTKAGTPGNVSGAPMAAAVVHPTLGYCAAHNDTSAAALIYRENTGADATPWLDFGTYFVPVLVKTAWIKQSDLQGWQSVRRVRLLGQYYAPHAISVSLNYDYQAQNEGHAWTDTTVTSVESAGWEQFRVIPARGRCEAIQVTVQTQVPTIGAVGNGRGGGLTGLAFEIRPKQGGFKRTGSAAQT